MFTKKRKNNTILEVIETLEESIKRFYKDKELWNFKKHLGELLNI